MTRPFSASWLSAQETEEPLTLSSWAIWLAWATSFCWVM